MSPFVLKTNGTYRKAIGIWDTALKELTQSFLLSVTEQRQEIKNCQGLWMAFQEHPCSSIPTPDSCFSPSCSGMWNAHAWGVRSWPRPNHISDQSRLSHCQCMLWCTHSGGSKTIPRMRSLRPELPPLCTLGEEGAISRAETAIVRVQSLCTLGRRWLQPSDATSTPPVLTQPLTKGHALGKSEASTELQSQALRTWYVPNQGEDCQHNQEKTKSPRESCSSPSGSSPLLMGWYRHCTKEKP